MKHVFLITAVFCSLIFSCKKKDVPKGTPYGTTTPPSGDPGTPSNSSVFHGVLYTGTSTFNSSQQSNIAYAYFTNQALPFPYNNAIAYTPVSLVLLNGDTLLNSGDAYASFSQTLKAVDNWAVKGSGGIPSFTVQNTVPRPTIVQTFTLPASLSKAAGVTVHLPKMSNIKTGYCIISDGSSSPIQTTTFSPGTQYLTLSPAKLSSLQTSTTAVIEIAGENYQTLEIGGKYFRFSKIIDQAQQITITQ